MESHCGKAVEGNQEKKWLNVSMQYLEIALYIAGIHAAYQLVPWCYNYKYIKFPVALRLQISDELLETVPLAMSEFCKITLQVELDLETVCFWVFL